VDRLRSSTGRRHLRLGVAPDALRDWLTAFPDVRVVDDQVDALRLDLPAEVDPLAVLDAARAAGPVTDFGLDLPTLSQLFLGAVGESAADGSGLPAGLDGSAA
jgi:ABC-2 type transport system ATP-binding protein